ncbi:peptidoglycan-binding domain-containing protein [Sinorhizobium sp. GL28]|uniref:peptidoglycan-binding domain-containing protein n=1 Tax=Sinorhizobium sp. GL28 TaxID=1358418 RepID=UPI001FD8AA6A|nr:peptidoglycan-binding domain-containing protein [Sinorhizobium sp. GL28]
MQVALAQLGYDIGSADGSFGKQTRREIARYQKALGLPETGFLTEVTIAGLNIPLVASQPPRPRDPLRCL